MRRLSIKVRVTLLCALLAVTIAASAMAWMLLGEARMLENYYLDTLVSTAQLARNEIKYENGKLEIDRNLDDLPSVGVAVFSKDGDLIYGRARFEMDFVNGELRSHSGWMIYDEALTFPEGDDLWLRCYMSADMQHSVRGGQRALMPAIFAAMVLLGGLGGYLIARRAFRPVSRIVRTAEGIAGGEDLKKRIGFEGTRDELYAIASTFDAMFERLDGAFERERRFTSDASHELRTPVAGILAQSEFAMSGDATDADRKEALTEIHRRAGDMSRLIGKLLTLSRMDAKRISPAVEDVDLGMLAEIAAAEISDAAQKKGMELCVDGEASVRADQTMAAQAVMNLAENAVRYGREGGRIRIHVCEDEKNARLSVADDGPGIPEDKLAHIFERFYQADPSHRGEGSGLGLSLVERIMSLHGGRVEVRSKPGEGSCFTLIFPKEGEK